MSSLPLSHASGARVGRSAACPAPLGTVALLMLLSGFAGLGYQVAWTQQLSTGLGHEVVAVLAVVGAFFGGLALGGWALGPRIERSARPGRWVLGLELAIAGWGLLLSFSLPPAGAFLSQSIGADASAWRHWSIAFAGPLLLLLPATAAMGATVPAMARVLDRWRDDGYAVGGLVAANTLGAMAGVLATAFVLVPSLGLAVTARLCVALNVSCAVLAALALWGVRRDAPARPGPSVPAGARRGWALRLGIGGLLGIGHEVIVVRVLDQLGTNTVYTYALLLAVYLAGSAAGAAFYQRRMAADPDSAAVRARLVLAALLGAVVSALLLAVGESLREALRAVLGPGFAAALAVEAGVAAAAFAAPTFAMGALFSHLCVEAREAGASLGRALAANTLGAAVAPPLFGLVLLPSLGPGLALAGVALAYVALLPARAWRAWGTALAMAPALALLVLGPALRLVDVPEGGRLIWHRHGVMAAVSVVTDGTGVRWLHVNNREPEGSNGTRFSDARQAWLPLLLHPAPRSVLFLGLGTGVTAAAAAADARLSVHAVELVPEVVEAAPLFVPGFAHAAQEGLRHAGVQVHLADARRHVRSAGSRHDVIVADLFHPARNGAAALYTVEHFAAVRARLAEGGLFCQWLPLHQLDPASLAAIVASFLEVYPQATAVLATHSLDTPVIGLVGVAGATAWTEDALEARLLSARQGGALAGLQLEDALTLAGTVVADTATLRRAAAGAAPNTDDRPRVSWHAAHAAYAPGATPRERLRALLAAWRPAAAAVFAAPAGGRDAEWMRRVEAYWAARVRYVDAGLHVRPSSDPAAMLAQVERPLVEVLRLSADFRPAYDALLRMATALGRQAPDRAAALLEQLQRLQPARAEAGEALRRLAPPR